MIRRSALTGVLLLMLSTASVSAASGQTVDVYNYYFTPTPATITLGAAAVWHNTTLHTSHTSTADLFSLWSRSLAPLVTSAPVNFQHSGTFAYHCMIHSTMHGKIKVKMAAAPTSGPSSTNFVIVFATTNAASGFIHDVQKRRAGGTFSLWKSTAAQSATFVAPRTGTFEFRARLRRLSDGVATGWSPTLTITVT